MRSAQGASDIHIEPDGPKDETAIRFRVDGRCYDYLKAGLLSARVWSRG